jgi:hypothetical protein
MRARVLRPHVDEHLVGTDVELDDPRIVFDEVWHGGSIRGETGADDAGGMKH